MAWQDNFTLPSSGLLHGVRLFETDISGPPISPILKGQHVQEIYVGHPLISEIKNSLICKAFKMAQIGGPETSVSNHLTSRNNPEDERIQFKGGGSLRSRKISFGVECRNSIECVSPRTSLHTGMTRHLHFRLQIALHSTSPGRYEPSNCFTFVVVIPPTQSSFKSFVMSSFPRVYITFFHLT